MQTQKLAMLGLGGRSTLFYLRRINELYEKISGRNAICPLLLKKTDFSKIDVLLPDQFFRLEDIMRTQLDSLKVAERVIVPNITLHHTISRLAQRSGNYQSVIDPVKSVIARLSKDNCDHIMLIGSQHTMNSDHFRDYFKQYGITVIVPKVENQQMLDRFRRDVSSFAESKSDIRQYLQLVSDFKSDYKVVIASTELSLILPHVEPGVYDMARAQIDEAMKLYEAPILEAPIGQ